jgi:molybdopterin/thiamine biosynthesis adenylyltransferase
LRLIDDDVVALSNLQRQVLYKTSEVGALKVTQAHAALSALNPHVEIEAHAKRLSDENARGLLAGAGIVLDGTDSFATRFAVNAACRDLGITLISGAVGRWDGQVAMFKPAGPCYRCLVPEIPPDSETCAQAGIVGALTGVIGALMAHETIKEIAGAGESLAGRLLIYDGLTATSRTISLPRDPSCAICGNDDGA